MGPSDPKLPTFDEIRHGVKCSMFLIEPDTSNKHPSKYTLNVAEVLEIAKRRVEELENEIERLKESRDSFAGR